MANHLLPSREILVSMAGNSWVGFSQGLKWSGRLLLSALESQKSQEVQVPLKRQTSQIGKGDATPSHRMESAMGMTILAAHI